MSPRQSAKHYGEGGCGACKEGEGGRRPQVDRGAPGVLNTHIVVERSSPSSIFLLHHLLWYGFPEEEVGALDHQRGEGVLLLHQVCPAQRPVHPYVRGCFGFSCGYNLGNFTRGRNAALESACATFLDERNTHLGPLVVGFARSKSHLILLQEAGAKTALEGQNSSYIRVPSQLQRPADG